MTEQILQDEILIKKIYYIRNQKVMVDEDLAELYGVPTKRLNEQVARNIDRFPEDFMFRLTEDEFNNLKSQFSTSSWGGRRKLPQVYTEHGVLMLSSVLNSKQAILVNIQIMRIFTRIRHTILDSSELKLEIEKIKAKVEKHGENLEIVFRYLDEMIMKNQAFVPRKRIGYKADDL
ncbi:MAG: DNA-binding protein [Subtercola sp.]|nr:DNA-binding protein [Subtercola sp.]